MTKDVADASSHSRFGVVRSEHHPRHTRENYRASALGTRLEGDAQRRIIQPIGAPRGKRLPNRYQFGVLRQVIPSYSLVVCLTDDLPGDYDGGADRDLARRDGTTSRIECGRHAYLDIGTQGRVPRRWQATALQPLAARANA